MGKEAPLIYSMSENEMQDLLDDLEVLKRKAEVIGVEPRRVQYLIDSLQLIKRRTDGGPRSNASGLRGGFAEEP